MQAHHLAAASMLAQQHAASQHVAATLLPPPPANDPEFEFDGCKFTIETVVAACQVQPQPQAKNLKAGRWEEALRRLLPLTITAGDAATYYDASAHPARVVCFGDGCVVLMYPNGRMVSYGRGKSEAVVLHQLQLGVTLMGHVLMCDARMEPMPKAASGPGAPAPDRVIETMVVTCPRPHPALMAALRDDVLFMEKMALRHPDAVYFVPEVLPAALVRPLLNTHWHAGAKVRKYVSPAVAAAAASAEAEAVAVASAAAAAAEAAGAEAAAASRRDRSAAGSSSTSSSGGEDAAGLPSSSATGTGEDGDGDTGSGTDTGVTRGRRRCAGVTATTVATDGDDASAAGDGASPLHDDADGGRASPYGDHHDDVTAAMAAAATVDAFDDYTIDHRSGALHGPPLPGGRSARIDAAIHRLADPLTGRGGPWYSTPALASGGPLVTVFESGLTVFSHCSSRDHVVDAFWAFKHRMVLPYLTPPMDAKAFGGSQPQYQDYLQRLQPAPGPVLEAGIDGLITIPPRQTKGAAAGADVVVVDSDEEDDENGEDEDDGEDEEDGDGEEEEEAGEAVRARRRQRLAGTSNAAAAAALPAGAASSSKTSAGATATKTKHKPSGGGFTRAASDGGDSAVGGVKRKRPADDDRGHAGATAAAAHVLSADRVLSFQIDERRGAALSGSSSSVSLASSASHAGEAARAPAASALPAHHSATSFGGRPPLPPGPAAASVRPSLLAGVDVDDPDVSNDAIAVEAARPAAAAAAATGGASTASRGPSGAGAPRPSAVAPVAAVPSQGLLDFLF